MGMRFRRSRSAIHNLQRCRYYDQGEHFGIGPPCVHDVQTLEKETWIGRDDTVTNSENFHVQYLKCL